MMSKVSRIERRPEALLVDEAPDLVGLANVMGDGADGMTLEEVDLDVEQPVENIFRHARIDARRDDLKEIVAQIEQHRFEHEEQGYADAKDGEGVEGAVLQHLAGDYAPEHHRREGEEGEGEGGRAPGPQQALLAKEQRHHQAPAEGLLFVEQLVVAPDGPARPSRSLQAHLVDDTSDPSSASGSRSFTCGTAPFVSTSARIIASPLFDSTMAGSAFFKCLRSSKPSSMTLAFRPACRARSRSSLTVTLSLESRLSLMSCGTSG